jgi:hypothetical protein
MSRAKFIEGLARGASGREQELYSKRQQKGANDETASDDASVTTSRHGD